MRLRWFFVPPTARAAGSSSVPPTTNVSTVIPSSRASPAATSHDPCVDSRNQRCVFHTCRCSRWPPRTPPHRQRQQVPRPTTCSTSAYSCVARESDRRHKRGDSEGPRGETLSSAHSTFVRAVSAARFAWFVNICKGAERPPVTRDMHALNVPMVLSRLWCCCTKEAKKIKGMQGTQALGLWGPLRNSAWASLEPTSHGPPATLGAQFEKMGSKKHGNLQIRKKIITQ